MRIKGLVAAANRVREQLKGGVPKQEVPHFKSYIQETLLTVEQLCAQEGTSPEALPVPSRKAYRFLKQIDLEQVPIQSSDSLPNKTLRFANIKRSHHNIQSQLWDSVSIERLKQPKIRAIQKSLLKQSRAIEQLCEQQGLQPQQLEGFSRSHYSWLKLLQIPGYLEAHLQALCNLKQQIEQLLPPTTQGFSSKTLNGNIAQLWIEFTPIQALYRHTQKGNKLIVRLSEGLIIADKQLIKTLGQQIILGKSAQRTQAIRRFSLSDEYQEVLLEMELILGQPPGKSQGRVYNLEQMFAQLNQSHFNGKLPKPTLTWSNSFTHRKFGHYCRSRNQIMLSQTLDDEQIPESVAAFVLYHEMLHIKHGAQWKNGKLWVHTPAFRKDERLFPNFEAAEEMLGNLADQLT